jgi:anti-sigma factor RsiW
MICSETKPLLNRHADGELPCDLGARVEAHLDECDACRWTASLLTREESALREALGGTRSRPPASGSTRRMIAAAAVALLLLGGSLLGLHRAYRMLVTDAASAAGRTVLIRAERLPLAEFVERLSEASGVPIVLEPASADRPLIDMVLVRPVRLESVLALLEEFHGLRSRRDGGRILIH